MTLAETCHDVATAVLTNCQNRRWRIGTAESCTGGLLAAALTAIPGSSAVFERGFVAYTNTAKHELLGVSEEKLTQYGAVSKETATAMVAGTLAWTPVELAVGITGIAGPGGGSDTKPVGLVYIGVGVENYTPQIARCVFEGDREAVRNASVLKALNMLREATS